MPEKGILYYGIDLFSPYAMPSPSLRLYQRHFQQKQKEKVLFAPKNPHHVGMYACGPTVYDRIHLGNARSFLVFDVLYRLLLALFPRVTYVRNITDVDDKINNGAKASGQSIEVFTQHYTTLFEQDSRALGLLSPTYAPRATDFIQEIIVLCQDLLARNHAYVAQGHVLFRIDTWPDYGTLSGASKEDMISGSRVEQAPYKENPLDFVLWKPAPQGDVGWPSPWGFGRPGWHSECTAMTQHYLGKEAKLWDHGTSRPAFDIHAGGSDLLFPHHENERAQACARHEDEEYAAYWVHSAMLLVDGKKMSKSLGNFLMLYQALEKNHPDVIRWALLSSLYRHPLDFNSRTLEQARGHVTALHKALWRISWKNSGPVLMDQARQWPQDDAVWQALLDDINTPLALQGMAQILHKIRKYLEGPSDTKTNDEETADLNRLAFYASLLGFQGPQKEQTAGYKEDLGAVEADIQRRYALRQLRAYKEADEIRIRLEARGIIIKDELEGALWHHKDTPWRTHYSAYKKTEQ